MTQQQVTLVRPECDAKLVGDGVIFDWTTSGHQLPGDWSIRQRTLRDGVSEGIHVVDLCNGPLTVSVLPTRGMGLWKADCRGIPVGWDSPVQQPVHPYHVDLTARNGLGWLDGFNELLCRCGLSFIGPPGIDEDASSPIESQLTLHGRVANLPAHTVEVGVDPDKESLWIRGVCDETCLFGPQLRLTSLVTLRIGESSIAIHDEVQNFGSRATDLSLLYHINVGPPFLGEGSRLTHPFRSMAPRDARAAEDIETWDTYLGPTPGYAEQAYFFEPIADDQQRSLAMLRNAAGDRGFSVGFDPRQLPCFTLWKCTQPAADGYVTGLEAGTNYPNFKAYERQQGRIPRLSPGDTYEVDLSLGIFDSAAAVTTVADRITSIQSSVDPHVHSESVEPFVAAD